MSKGTTMVCPHCGAKDIAVGMVEWCIWSTEDHSNLDTIDEHECQKCGLSFWCARLDDPGPPPEERYKTVRQELAKLIRSFICWPERTK